jgi:hypothetical protein
MPALRLPEADREHLRSFDSPLIMIPHRLFLFGVLTHLRLELYSEVSTHILTTHYYLTRHSMSAQPTGLQQTGAYSGWRHTLSRQKETP